ncbi:hypothetical protein [Nocardia mangyaensis]|uniref:hypothetical protein n=1 Tax=Nocardia mangyaensis TaxID=2213200 RepID=UPI002676553A|nr:hypothetical protein [Nocardia mangyaensis]MDO3645665.1 hypothetical protein [Nocardia mangyaensis]
MGGDSPSGMAEAFKRACIAVLVGVVALYCALVVIESIWLTLVVVIGVATLVGVPVVVVVIYRKMRGGW